MKQDPLYREFWSMNERRIRSLGKNVYSSAALPDSPWSEMLMMYLIEAFDAKPIAGGE